MNIERRCWLVAVAPGREDAAVHPEDLGDYFRAFRQLLDAHGYHRALHGHCHHKAIMRMDNESEVLEQMGVDSRQLDSGCCGMVGSFGFEKGERYEMSVKLGERVLLPEERGADMETLIVASGSS